MANSALNNATSRNADCANDERGYVLLLSAVMIVTLLTFGSLAIDIGWGRFNERQMQAAADLAALAGAKERLNSSAATVTSIRNTAIAVAIGNGLTSAEMQNGVLVEAGSWDISTATFTPETSNVSNVNAVRVRALRSVTAFLAPIFGQADLQPRVRAVAKVDSPSSATCLVPFGISATVLASVTPPATITITSSDYAAGNWGKLQLGPISLNGNDGDYKNAFLNGVCVQNVNIGDLVDVITGDAGLNPTGNGSDVFTVAAGDQKVRLVAVTSAFSHGSGGGSGGSNGKGKGSGGSTTGGGSGTVNIAGFAAMKVAPITGQGSNWVATLQILKLPFGTGTGGGAYSSDVVLVQ